MDRPKHILVLDHDGNIRQVVADLLVDLGYAVSLAKNDAAMRALLDSDRIDLIVLDASTSEAPGVDLALEAKERGIRLVMISGHPEIMERFQHHADQLLWKPFGREALERAIRHALASEVRGQRKADPN